jgi:two-component system, NarL family, invasion response regulator UvrY
MKVLIADDHWIVRKGLKEVLAEISTTDEIGEAANGTEVMEQLFSSEWDIIILDLSLPDKNGLDVLLEIKQRKPDQKVLILTMNQEDEIALRALKTGASGYLTKESVPEELINAINKIYNGGRYVSHKIAETIALSMEKYQGKAPHEALSDREFQVLCLIASGNSLKEISRDLCLSVKTVSTYRTRILEKLQLSSNVDMTHYAIKHRIIIPPKV